MSMDEYRNFLASAYNSSISDKQRQDALEYFLYYKSQTINHRDGCPPEAEAAIIHLKQVILASKKNTSGNTEPSIKWYDKYLNHPFIITIVGTTVASIIWHYIPSFLK